jgi:hypothetical protein
VAWYVQGGIRYPLRCGQRARKGWGYLHIRDDPPRPGEAGHGDPLRDGAFDLEMADTLARGAEALVGGGNWRYTLRYEGECTAGWGFRMVLAKLPVLEDGHPTGIITAFRYERAPKYYP